SGEAGLEALLANIVARRDAMRNFIAQIGAGDAQFRALFDEFGFSAGETQGSIAATLWPDAYFTATLAGDIGARAASAEKKPALKFAEDFGAACACGDPVERLALLRKAFFSGSGSSQKPRA